MPIKRLDFRGAGGGLVADSNEFTLADNEWSDLNNVRFHNRGVSRISGEEELVSLDNDPRHSQFVAGYSGGNAYYYYIDDAGSTHRVIASGDETEVTKGTGGTPEPLAVGSQYQMNAIGGGTTLLVNDGESTPQYITSVGSGSNALQLTDIPDWEYDDNFTDTACASIRPFKRVLVAMNITQTQTSDNSIDRNTATFRVSNQFIGGRVPSWDPVNAGADTASTVTLGADSEIVDGYALADSFFIFTRNQIYNLQLTGNAARPTNTRLAMTGRGMMAQGCAVEFFGKLLVVGLEDIYLFQGGAAAKSISDSRVRDYFYDDISREHFQNTYVVHNEREDEVWVIYPSTNSDGPCDRALIWNYTLDNWSKRDMNNVYPGSAGPTISNGEFALGDFAIQLPTDSKILTMDRGDTFDGEPINAYLERKGMFVMDGNSAQGYESQNAYFLITGKGSGAIHARASDYPGREIDLLDKTDRWLRDLTFNAESDFKKAFNVRGKFFNCRVLGSNAWNLHYYDIFFEEGGDELESRR